MDETEKRKKSTVLNESDRKVLYKYANHCSEKPVQLAGVENCNTLNNKIRNTNKEY
ncbi:hypothetical protein LY28_00520 [Ruminiclostridium sufflavum DSM 19573]|uniref:Uncharacterized protein n=1 Tax=Ruminiclostridium sufflavum DSM 19573 TaxID=1121337 RepID=A0A318XP56_9FIRM|nr:hypothetical protein [Ruminiclostridium sufflavum]PYG89920.1 hypothetical protein LY28_00520 [Ruminiclostridium sufflavum DSM 19573]